VGFTEQVVHMGVWEMRLGQNPSLGRTTDHNKESINGGKGGRKRRTT